MVSEKMIMDRHGENHLPYANQGVWELRPVVSSLLESEVVCWPWIDLMSFYFNRRVDQVRWRLEHLCQVVESEHGVGRDEKRIVFGNALGVIRLHWKWTTFEGVDGKLHSGKIGRIKLPDCPSPALQEFIANLLWQTVGEDGWSFVSIEFGADIIPQDFSASGSKLRQVGDPLMPVAEISKRKGVPPALVELQDLIERTLHLNHGGKCIKYDNKIEITTAYWGSRDRDIRVKVYPGPKDVPKEECGFLRLEITVEHQALLRCLLTGQGGLKFPTLPNGPDMRDIIKLLVPKDFDALVESIHRKDVKEVGRSRLDKLKFRATKRHLETDLRTKPHSDFRDVIHSRLGGGNLAYHFQQLYPVNPGTFVPEVSFSEMVAARKNLPHTMPRRWRSY